MLTVRKANERGHADHGWLNSHHTFSFGSYYDAEHMGISNLRVINDDTVSPGEGFPTHGHSDMEIVSYVLEGALEHKDSMGNGSVIYPGDVQRMSAGTGVRHSEYNPSSEEQVHFLQIWLAPNKVGVEPGYDQQHFPLEERVGKLVLFVSPDGRDGSIATHQDALLYGTVLKAGDTLSHQFEQGRHAYVHLARGKAMVNGQALTAGDGLAMSGEQEVNFEGIEPAEILLFDMV
ncbi:MAG: pirin family protein [Candidatus Thiodiazotropha sp. (ex. Lucinisca nassula)]|nr:pirin family protein [Candidatus Thiodiazotropha sp. (ex. Lucinisca nassula)]MBW9271622.1 pirin family protein [Candidatus Thiodiazotropha sp. (ex. Lucinisca nassula)]MCG7865426.1 pirin family protein [Candidatus Thiodiazotropha taylori]